MGPWQSHMKMNPGLDFPSLTVDFVISAPPALLSFVLFCFEASSYVPQAGSRLPVSARMTGVPFQACFMHC